MAPKDTRNSVESLLKIMQELRAPDGCPWDAEQTPESLAPYILEEACELIEAIEGCTPELILDELGDLNIQSQVKLLRLIQEKESIEIQGFRARWARERWKL